MINDLILPQNFEIVRDAIGYVLKTELISQAQKTGSRLTENCDVFLERTTPIQNEEEVVINIVLVSNDFSNKTQQDSQGKTFFNIDFYSRGHANQQVSGSLNSALKLHKYIGFVRSVLQNTEYKTLGLPLGIIGGTMIESFNIMENKIEQDSDFLKMGTISYSVRVQENQSMAEGVNFEGIFSIVKLDLTDLGYIYQKI